MSDTLKIMKKKYNHKTLNIAILANPYSDIVEPHDVCNRHGFLYTGFKQTERAILLTLFQWGKKWNYCYGFKMYIFEETVPKFTVICNSQDSYDNQNSYPS